MMKSSRFAVGTLFTLGLMIVVAESRAIDFEWVGLGSDNHWTNTDNWDNIVFPDALDNILLSGASAMGPVTIDLGGSQSINRIEHQGVDGNYTFGETIGGDTITIFQAGGNALVNTTTGSDLIINANVLLNEDDGLLRFDSVNGSDTSGKILVRGDVAPAAGATGTQTLVLTSTNKSGSSIVEVNGVISDGAGAVLGVNAGLEETQSSSNITDHAGHVQLSGSNEFTGPVRVTGGTLVFDSIEDVGSPNANALGMPLLADSDIVIGDNNVHTGTLRYIGSGHSSDRLIAITSTSSNDSSSATIDASGTGALILSGGIAPVSSNNSRTLNLAGDNSDNNSISGVIEMPSGGSGVLHVNKNGTGKWVLSASNNYDGATNVNAGELVIEGPSGAIGTTTSTIDVNPGGTLTVDGGTVTTNDLDVDSGATFNFNSGVVTLAAGASLFVDEDMNIGTDTGAAGAGTLSITSSSGAHHTFEGIAVSDSFDELSITGGTVNAQSVDNSNGGTFTFTGGTLDLNTADMGLTTGAGTIGGRLIGPGDVTKIGTGTLIHDLNSHTNSGDTNINEGTLQVTATGRLSDGTTVNVASGATLEFLTTSADAIFGLNGAGDVKLGDAGLVLGNNSGIGAGGGAGTFSGTISDDFPGPGVGDLEKRGSGTFTLSGQATHTGFTDIENGELIVSSGTIIGTSTVTVTNGPLSGGGTLTIENGGITTPGNIVSETSSSTFNLLSGGISANKLDLASGSSYLSSFNWTSGLIHLSSVDGLDVGVAPGIDQPFQNDLDLPHFKYLGIDATTTIGAAGTLSITGGTLTTGQLDNTSGGSFNFESGTLEFTQDQTFDATFAEQADVNTPIQAGRTLEVTTQATVDTPLVVAGGSVRFGSVVNPENIILDSGVLSVTASDLNVAAATSMDASTGMTVGVPNGAMNVAAGGTYSAIGSTLNVESASTNDGEINAINADLIFTGGLTNNGDMNLINTNVTGTVTNTATSSSTLVGINSVSDDYTMATGGALFIDIEGILPSEFDSLSIGGDAALAGALNVSVDPSFSLLDGQSFQILDIDGTQSGMFTGLADGAPVGNFGGVDLFIDYGGGDGNDVVLFVGAAPGLPGDGNGDGWVDGLDYLLWAGNYNSHPGPDGDTSDGDYNDDGWVDGLDYLLWAGNFGAHAAVSVPEPSGLALLVVGCLFGAIRCRR